MRKKILHNLSLKLFSIVIAVVLWFVAVIIEDPQESKTFRNIPISLTNTEVLDEVNKAYEVLDKTDTATVTVYAPKSVIDQLRATDIVAVADVSKLTDINTVAITYSIQNVDVEVNKITGSRDVVKLSVEDKKKNWVNVKYEIEGEVAENYIVYSVVLDQTRLEISGPESVIDKINYAEVKVDVSGATRDVSVKVDPLLYDAEGNLVESYSLVKNTNDIHVDVEVLAVKEVPVEVNSMGVPAEGYLATGVVESSIQTVQIAGRTAYLNGVNKITVPAEVLDITGVTDTLTKNIIIKDYLPANIKLADSSSNGRFTVSVYVEPVAERTLVIPDSIISVKNIPADYDWEFVRYETDKPHQLEISGLNAVISQVDANAVFGTVDIAAWMREQQMTQLVEGIYEIPVDFTLDEEISIDNEVVVRVKIVKIEEEESNNG